MTTSLWWQTDGADRATNVIATVDSYASEQEARRKRILRNLRLYEGRSLGDLSPRSYYTDQDCVGVDGEPYRVNLARALVATATAKIAGKQRPKTQFCTTDAEWSVKRKAKKKERLVEAAMLARQGGQHDAYAMGLSAFRDCCYADVGVLKFWADKQARRVAIDRILPWELIVDPNESRAGAPLNYFHDYGYDRFKLLDRFQGVKGAEEAIMTAPAVSDNYVGGFGAGGVRDKARLVRVCEAWRMALSSGKPGAHALCVGGLDLTEGEEWERQFPPFEFMLWEPWMMGFFGTSLVDIAAPLCQELNASFERWARAEKLGSNMVGQYERGSIDQKDLEANDTVTWIPRAPGSAPASLNPPETMGAASIQWHQIVKALAFEISGVSQMDASARKEPGITADVAIRTMQNIGSERFAVQWQQYERVMAIGAPRQILACIKELEEDGEGVVVHFPAGSLLQELNSKDLADYDVPDAAIQICAVSGLVNTPADRLDLAEKLLTMGIISPESFKRVIQYKDIDGELEDNDEQSTLLRKYIEAWLDATPENDKQPLKSPVSLKWMNLEEAILQVGKAAMGAELDECPDYNLRYFLDFLALCDREIQKRAASQAQLQAAAGGSAPALQSVGGGGGAAPPPPGAMPPPPAPMPMQGAA